MGAGRTDIRPGEHSPEPVDDVGVDDFDIVVAEKETVDFRKMVREELCTEIVAAGIAEVFGGGDQVNCRIPFRRRGGVGDPDCSRSLLNPPRRLFVSGGVHNDETPGDGSLLSSLPTKSTVNSAVL